jgi:hypothetical protein
MNSVIKASRFMYFLIIIFILAFFLGLSNDRQAVEAHPLNNGYSEITVMEDGVAYELFMPDYSLVQYDHRLGSYICQRLVVAA